MKRITLFFCLIFSVLIFSACSPKINPKTSDKDLNLKICECIEQVENIESFNNEAIKALSVIFRTNIINGNLNPKVKLNSKFLNLVEQTNGEILIVKDSKKINLVSIPEQYTWKKEIKKADLLSFLNQNNISLANIKNIEPVFDQNKNLTGLIVGGKNINYFTLKEKFNLESSKITNIEVNKEKNSIIISGEGKDLDKFDFDLNKTKNLSESGKNYKQILNYFFDGFEIKTV